MPAILNSNELSNFIINPPSDAADSDSDNESDGLSVVSTPFSSVPTESSATSYEAGSSLRSESPAPSVLSMTSSMRADALRQEYGRSLNNYSEVYRLPADEEELERLNNQHYVLIDLMGGKYPPPLPEIMADNVPGERKACLDLGCGSGSWIMDVARDFPDCEAVAVDLVPMQSLTMPPNLRSEVDDVNLGLEHFYGDFNVVHCRLISSGIKDYYRLIDQISRVLRPGGLIEVAEFDFHIYGENHERIETGTHELGPPWWARWMAFVASAARARGGDLDAATHLYEWISNHPAYEDPVYREFFLPVITSPRDSEFMHRMGEMMKDDVMAFQKSARPLLLGSGMSESMVSEIEQGAIEELREGKIAQYTRLQCVYARKKQS